MSNDIKWAARDLDVSGHLFPDHDTHWRHSFEVRHAKEVSHAASVATTAIRQLVAIGAFEAHDGADVEASAGSASDGGSLANLHRLRRMRMVQIGQELSRARGDAESPLQALRAAAEVLQNATVVQSLLAEAAARVAEGAGAGGEVSASAFPPHELLDAKMHGGAAGDSPARAVARRYLQALEAALSAAAEKHMREQLGDLWSPMAADSPVQDAEPDIAAADSDVLLEVGSAADRPRLRSRPGRAAAAGASATAGAAADLGSFRRDAAAGNWDEMARRGNARLEAAEAHRTRSAGSRLAMMLLETQARAEELLEAGVATREIFACVVDQIMNMAPEIVLQIIMNTLVPQFIKLLMQLLMTLLLDILVPSLSGLAMSVMGKLSTTPAAQPCVCKGPDDTAYDPAGGLGYTSFLAMAEGSVASVGAAVSAGVTAGSASAASGSTSFAAKAGVAAAAAAAAASGGTAGMRPVMHDVPMTPNMRAVMNDVASFLETEGQDFGVDVPAYDWAQSSRASGGRPPVNGKHVPFGSVGASVSQAQYSAPHAAYVGAAATATVSHWPGNATHRFEHAGAFLEAAAGDAGASAGSGHVRSSSAAAAAAMASVAIGFAEVNGVRLQLIDLYPECPCRPGHMGYRYLQLNDAQPLLPPAAGATSASAAAKASTGGAMAIDEPSVHQEAAGGSARGTAATLLEARSGTAADDELDMRSARHLNSGGSEVQEHGDTSAAAADPAHVNTAFDTLPPNGRAWSPFETLAFLERQAGIPQLERTTADEAEEAADADADGEEAADEASVKPNRDRDGSQSRFAAGDISQRSSGRGGGGSREAGRSRGGELDALAARGRSQMEIAAAMEAAQKAQADAFAESSAWLFDTVYDGSGGAASTAEWAAALAAAGKRSSGKKKGPIADIEPKVNEAVEAGLRDLALPRLLGLVAEGVKQRAGRTAPLAAHRAISRDAIQGITRRLTISLYRRTMLALAQPLVLRVVTRLTAQLTPALAMPLSLSLVHSLTHHPAADLFCEYCAALGELPPLEEVIDITGEPREVQQEAQRRGAYCTACQRTLAHDRAQDEHVAALVAKHAPGATAAVIERIPDITAKVLGVSLPPAAASSPYKNAVMGAAIANKKGKKKGGK